MMAVIEPQFQRDFISLLPKELALYVLSFLTPRDLTRAAQTCRCWRVLAEDNLLWREKCREAGIDDVRDTLNKRRLRKSSHYSSPDLAKTMHQSEGDKINLSWSLTFIGCKIIMIPCIFRQLNIELNWRVRPIL
jgi:F-box/WD-40 domain protein 7